MKYALVIADVPKLDLPIFPDEPFVHVATLENNIARVLTKDQESVKRLGLGVYLIALEKTLPLLTDVLYNAQRLHVPLRVLFLDEEPSWVTS